MAIIAATQTIETSIDKTLSAVAGIIQRVINTHASDDITVTYGTNTADISAGQFVDFWYDGTTWRSSIIYVNPWAGNFKSYSNITAKRNASNPNYQVDIEWDSLYIEGILSTSGDFTLDITTSGLLGLDTGSEAVSTWYYIWAIAKTDGTVSAILSISSTSPTMPLGYTLKRLVSMGRNDSSGNFVDFVQENEDYGYSSPQTAKNLTSTSNETLDCSQWIPLGVNEIKINLRYYDTWSSAFTVDCTVYSESNGIYYISAYDRKYGIANYDAMANINATINTTTRSIKYITALPGGNGSNPVTRLAIYGFKVPL